MPGFSSNAIFMLCVLTTGNYGVVDVSRTQFPAHHGTQGCVHTGAHLVLLWGINTFLFVCSFFFHHASGANITSRLWESLLEEMTNSFKWPWHCSLQEVLLFSVASLYFLEKSLCAPSHVHACVQVLYDGGMKIDLVKLASITIRPIRLIVCLSQSTCFERWGPQSVDQVWWTVMSHNTIFLTGDCSPPHAPFWQEVSIPFACIVAPFHIIFECLETSQEDVLDCQATRERRAVCLNTQCLGLGLLSGLFSTGSLFKLIVEEL